MRPSGARRPSRSASCGDLSAGPALYAALGDADAFAAWSVRQAIRRLDPWDKSALVEALLDERRLESALRLTDEAWAVPVVDALTEALARTSLAPVRGRIVANLAGLFRRYPEWSGAWFGSNPLAGAFPQKTKDWSPDGMKGVIEGLTVALLDRDNSVRFQAIVGLSQAGADAAPALRSALAGETDPTNLAVAAEALGSLKDAVAVPALLNLLTDVRQPEAVRVAALGALAPFRDRQSLRPLDVDLRHKGARVAGGAGSARPGPIGVFAPQRSGFVSGESRPRSTGCRTVELECQEGAAA